MSTFFRNLNHHWKCREQKGNFLENPGHNILKLSSVLVQDRLATSKAILDIWYNKLGIRVLSRVAEQLKM